MSVMNEAFKRLDLLDEEVISLDDNGIKRLAEIEDEDQEDIFSVTDIDADTEEELKDSYEGKVIIDCNLCHSKIFKDKDDIHLSEDGETCNEDEECPYCYSHDGYSIIGEVAPFHKDEDPKEDGEDKDGEEVEVEKEVEVEGEKELDESLYYLKPEHDSAQSFYNKATVEVKDDGSKVLYSYNTPVVRIKDGEVNLLDLWDSSMTTLRHVREFLQQEGFEVGSKSKMASMYECLSELGEESVEPESNVNESVKNSIGEDFKKVEIETEDNKMTMESDDSGKVVVTNEPVVSEDKNEEEVIAPVSDEVKAEIEAKSEDDDYVDLDVDEFEEEDFDKLGEGYLKKVYENVNSYKTSSVKMDGNKLIIEGVINFTSGKNKKTSFMFESKTVKGNKVKFIGENAQITKGKKAFRLEGTLNDKKFIGESLSYRYSAKGNDGKSQRLYGTIKK